MARGPRRVNHAGHAQDPRRLRRTDAPAAAPGRRGAAGATRSRRSRRGGAYTRAGPEPPLEEVLRDPIVQLVMRADRAQPVAVRRRTALRPTGGAVQPPRPLAGSGRDGVAAAPARPGGGRVTRPATRWERTVGAQKYPKRITLLSQLLGDGDGKRAFSWPSRTGLRPGRYRNPGPTTVPIGTPASCNEGQG